MPRRRSSALSLGVVNHAVARAEFASEIRRENFGGDDVRADGNDFFAERWCGGSDVGAAGEENFTSRKRAARSGDTETTRAIVGLGLYVENPRVIVKRCASTLGRFGQARNVLRGIYACAGFVDEAAEIDA